MYDSEDDFYIHIITYYQNKEIEAIDAHIDGLKKIQHDIDNIQNDLQEHINLINKNLDDYTITQEERNNKIKTRYIKNKANTASNPS